MRAQATPVIHIDDARFRVTEWRFPPGAETGWHRHGHDYVIVPLTDGHLRLEMAEGQTGEAALRQGVPYSRREGVEHNVQNASDSAALAFLEVEVVDDALSRLRRAVLVQLMAALNRRDLDAVMACMAADCVFHAATDTPPPGQSFRGTTKVRAAFAAFLESHPQASWTEDEHVVAGETGLSTWRFQGTTRQGGRVDLRGCDVFSFREDKIARMDSYTKPESRS